MTQAKTQAAIEAAKAAIMAVRETEGLLEADFWLEGTRYMQWIG